MDGLMKVCKRINIKPQVDKFVFGTGRGVIRPRRGTSS
jgi:hypothetical protein